MKTTSRLASLWSAAKIVLPIALSVTGPLRAATASEAPTLSHLPGVKIAVAPIEDNIQKLGVFPDSIQAFVELRLRQAGIRVLTYSEWLNVQGQPYLAININAMLPSSEASVVYYFAVQLHQIVRLVRASDILDDAITWSSQGRFGITPRESLWGGTRRFLTDAMDQFNNDYLVANPGGGGSSPSR